MSLGVARRKYPPRKGLAGEKSGNQKSDQCGVRGFLILLPVESALVATQQRGSESVSQPIYPEITLFRHKSPPISL